MTGTGFGTQMTEYCIGWMLHLSLRFPLILEFQSNRTWNDQIIKQSKGTLFGKTLCILGSGNIGKSLAQAGKFFGIKLFINNY